MRITHGVSCLADGSQPRRVAACIVAGVTQGGSLTTLLTSGLSALPDRDRPLVRELCFGVVRWYYRLQAILEQMLDRPIKFKDSDIRALILVGLYQLLYMRVPAHAAVGETVQAARGLGKPWAAGLINGLLRRCQRESIALQASVDEQPEARYAHPAWMLQKLRLAWPDSWSAIVEAANSSPPMSLRVNLSRISRQRYLDQLQRQGIAAGPIPTAPSGLVLELPMNTAELPGFQGGLVSVQDGGAQLAAGLMDLQPGHEVLDACAAPGGKSCHMLESTAGIKLTAVDQNAARLEQLHENFARLRLSAEVYVGDASAPAGPWTGCRYDRILLDLPCSATGVIRRHPDIKLLRRAQDIGRLASRQQEILTAIWPLLKAGGMLLYATCSLLPEENELQLRRFLQNVQDAEVVPIDADWGLPRDIGRQTLPGRDTMDGFYYARLKKVPKKSSRFTVSS